MNRQNRFHLAAGPLIEQSTFMTIRRAPGPQEPANSFRVDIESRWVDVYEDGQSALEEQAVGGGNEAEGGRQDFVLRPYSQRANAQVQRGCSAVDGYGIAGTDVSREFLFEFAHHRAQAKLTRAQHPCDVFDFYFAYIWFGKRYVHSGPCSRCGWFL